jgi:hypothetical protein
MEDDLNYFHKWKTTSNSFLTEDLIFLYCFLEDNLTFWNMEDDLNFLKMKDDLNYFYKWKRTLNSVKCKTTTTKRSILLLIENSLKHIFQIADNKTYF